MRDITGEIADFVKKFTAFLLRHPNSENIARKLYIKLYRPGSYNLDVTGRERVTIFGQTAIILLIDPKAQIVKELLRDLPPLPEEFNLPRLREKLAEVEQPGIILGSFYQKLVGGPQVKKGLALFFTEPPAAYLLASLAEPESHWKVADFCCGCGILLGMVCKVIEENYGYSRASYYACDVLRGAGWITAYNLASASEAYVYVLPLGFENGQTYLGSLEFARRQKKFNFHPHCALRIYPDREEAVELPALGHDKFDLIIMNPPFSRPKGGVAGKRFSFIGEARQFVWRDYVAVQKTTGGECPLVAGDGLMFFKLANQCLKEGGKLALILPKTLLSGTSWLPARRRLLRSYRIEYIVTHFAPDGSYSFSQGSSLAECMLIARKKTGQDEQNGNTQFVLLRSAPKTIAEAKSLAKGVKSGVIEDAQGFILSIPQPEMEREEENWGRFVFAPDIRLIETLRAYRAGALGGGELIRLDRIVASMVKKKKGFLQKLPLKEGGKVKIILGGGENTRLTMSIRPQLGVDSEKLEKEAGRLLLPAHLDVDTAHTIANLSPDLTLANSFISVRLMDEHISEALCLWLNSFLGILSILAERIEISLHCAHMGIAHWGRILVPNFSAYPPAKLAALTKLYNTFANVDFGRLQKQFSQPGARMEMDMACFEILGLRLSHSKLMELYEACAAWLAH